jgi:hypothetical protein
LQGDQLLRIEGLDGHGFFQIVAALESSAGVAGRTRRRARLRAVQKN